MKGVFVPEAELKTGQPSTRNLSVDGMKKIELLNSDTHKAPPAIRCSNNASPTTRIPEDCMSIMKQYHNSKS